MTTYAYPITLNERVFNDLYMVLQKLCEESERNGNVIYDPETKKPIWTFSNILEVMNGAKVTLPKDKGGNVDEITFTLTDYLFIPLENLLKEKCREYKEFTKKDPFDPITGEPQLNFASMLEAIRFAIKNSTLNSWSSYTERGPIKLWSPKQN